MTFRDRWLRRTDDARRTKGDPPPTYAQLMANIRQTQAALALAEQIATNLRHQCDGLIVENARLRVVAAEKTEYAEALALELAQWNKVNGTAVLLLAEGERVGIAQDDRTGHYWHAVPGSHLPACSRCRRWMTDWSLINPCDAAEATRLDPDPARPYIKSPEATT